MHALRPAPLLRAVKINTISPSSITSRNTIASTSQTVTAITQSSHRGGYGGRGFASTTVKQAEHAHEDHYDPPSGWLWGIKPGEKPEKEGWENLFIYGFFGTLLFGAVAYAFKPDTSIQTWALEEARRRLEAEGILKEPEDKP